MAPLIYFAASLPLLIGSAVYAFLTIVMRAESEVFPFISLAGMFYIIAMILVSMVVRSIRGTYGDRVTQVIIASSAVLIFLGDTTYNPWQWIYVGIWALLLTGDIWLLRRCQKALRMTTEQKWDLDSLSMRLSSPLF